MIEMGRSDFLQARDFIYRDLQREIAWAYLPERRVARWLPRAIRVPTGANLLAALGLLCYTEFAGRLRYNVVENRRAVASKNFHSFFDDLRPASTSFRAPEVNVYAVFRCDLAHEHVITGHCDISMMKGDAAIGIGQTGERYWFVVEKYFEDFRIVFDTLREELFA